MTFTPAGRTEAVKPSAVLEMIRLARDLERAGRPVSFLVQGEPDFSTPRHIQEAAFEAMQQGYTHYPPAEGYPELKVAVAEKLERDNSLRYDPEREILITNGAALGLFLAVNAVVEPGDEVIVLDPTFGSYAMIAESAGARLVRVPLALDGDGRRLDGAALRRAAGPSTRALVLCSPDNPTGHVLSEEELRLLGDVAVEHDLVIIADEVYEHFLYDGSVHHSVAALDPAFRERTVVVNSFSKTYAMTGWRLGYNAAPAGVMQAMTRMNAVAGRAAAAFTQRAGLAALRGPQDEVESMRRAYAARRALMLDALAGVPDLRYNVPAGGFYVFVDCRDWRLPSDRLARELLERGGVVTTPGDYYGPGGRGFLRLSFASSERDIRTGMAGLTRALADLKSERA